MRNLLWLVPVGAFFLNPDLRVLGRTAVPVRRRGDARRRRGRLVASTITPAGGTAMQVTVHIEQSPTAPTATAVRLPSRALVRAANACGTRTLVKSAGACIDESEMPRAR